MKSKPAISLRPVTRDNFHDVVELKVREDQKTFVAPNVYSIAESKYYPWMTPEAIYAGETLVGFTMTGYSEKDAAVWIIRLMIADGFQGKGYGREAMRQIIANLSARPDCDRILISYEPENRVAKMLYASLGFAPTGEIRYGEEVACLTLATAQDP